MKSVLLNNYPNPFNPSILIAYEVPAATHVVVSIYDMLGREMTRLVNEEKNAGQ
ncbi:MAG: T9SS type A sorting domain-containing protein [Bacteroidota bacterium]